MSVHPGLHRNSQWWVPQTLRQWQQTAWHCNTSDRKWFTDMWRRTVVDDFWSRSHLTWWACANLSWALLHWNVVASQSCSITIMTVSFFETRQWIWSLTIVPTHHSGEWNPISQSDGDGWGECGKWRGWGSLRPWWRRETWGSRSFSWWPTSNRRCGSSWTAWHFWWNENSKNITYSWTAHRRCEDGTQRNSAMYHIRGNAQWWSDQLHVRSERWLWGLDEGNPATFWSLRFPRSSHPSMRQRDEHHWRLQKSCTRTNRENSVKICAQNKSSEQRVCRSSTRTNSGTRTMLSDTHWDEHWHTASSNFTCHSICDSSRWICAVKIHSATRRQNAIPIFARNSMCITFVHIWWICIRFDPRSRSAGSQTDEQMDQWLLVGTRCIVWRTHGGDEAWFAQVQISPQKTYWRAVEPTWNGRGSRDEMEFWRGYGFWNTWTANGFTSRWRDANSDGTGGDSYSTSTRQSRARNSRTRSARARHARPLVRGSHTLANAQRLGREPPNRISGGGETWSRCRSRYTTTGPEWKFDGSWAEEDKKWPLWQTTRTWQTSWTRTNFRRRPATSYQLEPVDDGNVSKKRPEMFSELIRAARKIEFESSK